MARKGKKKGKGSPIVIVVAAVFVLAAIGAVGGKKESTSTSSEKRNETTISENEEITTKGQKETALEEKIKGSENTKDPLPRSNIKSETEAVKKETEKPAIDNQAETVLLTENAFDPIQRGASGDSVIDIQSQLVALGFLTSSVDGKFGPGTEQAVKDFQNANQLEPNGVVDKATYDALMTADIDINEREQSSAMEATTEVRYVCNTNTMKFHYPSCSSVGQIKESNRMDTTLSRDELMAQGYEPCGNCHP